MIKDIDILKKAHSEDEDESNKPDILLIDLPVETYDKLESKGFNVFKGSFGSPYKVKCSNNLTKVRGEEDLPMIYGQYSDSKS
jgi:hypothetical protein